MQQEVLPVISVPARKVERFKNSNDSDDSEQIDTKALMEQNHKFFLDYSRLYEANVILKAELANSIKKRNELDQYIKRLNRKEKKELDEKGLEIDDAYTNRKRHRRSKKEIARSFVCPNKECAKSYGSEGSLNQHIKIKHSSE